MHPASLRLGKRDGHYPRPGTKEVAIIDDVAQSDGCPVPAAGPTSDWSGYLILSIPASEQAFRRKALTP